MNTVIMAHIKLEDEVIDVESGDDPVIIWNQTVETLMKKSFNGQLLLEDIVRYYSRSLRNQLRFSKEKALLREKIYTHLAFFNAQYMELNDFMNTSNYYELMEDVLAYYCTLEFDLLRLSFPNKSSESTRKNYMPDVRLSTKRICTVLTTYLGQREVHILHVLLKMKYSTMSQAGNEVRRQLYYYILFGDMSNVVRTIASYCRNYILFLQYMELVNKNCQTQAKDLFYKKFGDKQIIMNNSVLKRILTINSSEAVNVYRDVNSLKSTVVKKYFASLKELNEQVYSELNEIDFKQFSNVEEDELSRQIFGKSNMEQTLLITDSDPEEVFTIDDDDDVTIQSNVNIHLPSSQVKKYGSDVKLKSIEIPRRRKKKKTVMQKTRNDIPDAIIELDCDETDIKTPRENVNPSRPPTAASASIVDTKSGLEQSIINKFPHLSRASKHRRSQPTLRNSCDTRDTGLYPNTPLSVNNNVTNFVKDECESLNNSDASEKCSTSSGKVGVRSKTNDLMQKRNKLKNGRINGAKYGSPRQSSQNINPIEIIELDCDEPTAPQFSQESIKASPDRLKEECLSETSDCDNKHQVTVKNLLEMMAEDYLEFRRDVCERVPNPHPIDSNLNKTKPACTEIDKENINVSKNNNNFVTITTAEVPSQLEGLQKNICDKINDRLKDDLYDKNVEMDQVCNVEKEQPAVSKEVSELHNKTINNIPRNFDDDNMASTIKRITSISLEDSSKENPQCSEAKTVASGINADAKEDVDPETLKELNKHNFDNVSKFYDFLHSLRLGKLEGLVKGLCPNRNHSDNDSRQLLNQDAVETEVQNQESKDSASRNLNSDNNKESEVSENQQIAELEIQQPIESENQEIIAQLENQDELNEMQNTRSFRTLAERKQMPLQTEVLVDSVDKQVVSEQEPLNPQQSQEQYSSSAFEDIVTSDNLVTIDEVQSNIIIEKIVSMDSSEVMDIPMEVEEQNDDINASELKIEELRSSEQNDPKLIDNNNGPVYVNNEVEVIEGPSDNIEEEAAQTSQPEAQNHKELTSELMDIFKKIEQVTRSSKMEAPTTNGDASSSEDIFLKLIEVYKDKFDVKNSAEVVGSSFKPEPAICQEEAINSKENELHTESEPVVQGDVEDDGEELPEVSVEAEVISSSFEPTTCPEKEVNHEENELNVIQNEDFVIDGSNTLIIYNIVAKYEDVTHVPVIDTNNYEDGIIVDDNSQVISQNCSTCTQSPVPLHCIQNYGKLTPPSDENTEENYIPQKEEINNDKNINDNLLNDNILLTPSGSEEKDESIAEDNTYYTEYYEGDIMNTSVNIDGTLQAIKTENVDVTDNQIMGDIVYSPINLFEEEECIDKDENSIEPKNDNNQAKIGILQNVLISPNKKVLASVTPHYNLLNSQSDSIKREVSKSPTKIMYTSKQMIDKTQLETNFDQIKSGQIDEFQDIQDSFSGPLRKINDTNAIIDKYDCDNYDLFNYETTKVKNTTDPSTKSTKLSVRFGGVKTTTFYDEPSTSGNYEDRYSSRSNSPTSDESKTEIIQKPKIRSIISTKSIPKNKTPLLRPAFNPLLFMDVSAPYERLKRKLNMEDTSVPVKIKAVERSDNYFFSGSVYCEANPLDEKLTKKRAVINLARVTEEELSENYYKTLPDRDLKNHHTKRRCILRRIDVKREELKETPVASPSRIPDPAEFLEKNPVTGKHGNSSSRPFGAVQNTKYVYNFNVNQRGSRGKRKPGRPAKNHMVQSNGSGSSLRYSSSNANT